MNAKDNGSLAAFPGDDFTVGLTKREEFARTAMQGLASFEAETLETRMEAAVKHADALLEELAKEVKP